MSAGHLVETGPPRELLASVNSHLAAMARHTGAALGRMRSVVFQELQLF